MPFLIAISIDIKVKFDYNSTMNKNTNKMIYEVSIKTTHSAEELVSDALEQLGVLGVTVVDKQDVFDTNENTDKMGVPFNDMIGNNWDYVDDEDLKELYKNSTKTIGDEIFSGDDYLSGEVLVKASMIEEIYNKVKPNLEDILSARKENARGIIDFGSLEIKWSMIQDKDWENSWKDEIKPIIVKDVTIIPNWIRVEDVNSKYPVIIERDMAFGTGEHETTSNILMLMQEIDFQNKTVFDIGCGSGVLGILASKMGASKVIMSDIDIRAIDTAKRNIKYNKVINKVEVVHKSLLTGEFGCTDIILANINARILYRMAEDMAKLVHSESKIILSGIKVEEINEIEKTFLSAGFIKIKTIQKNDWIGILLEKK